MQFDQLLPTVGPLPKIPIERNAWKLANQVQGIFFPIHRIVENGIDVVENSLLRKAMLRLPSTLVTLAKLVESPVCNIVSTIFSILVHVKWHLLVCVNGRS